MKRIYFTLIALLAAVVIFALSSCEKKEILPEEDLTLSFEAIDEDSASIIIRLCYNEMKDEPLLARTAFCAMILNRMESDLFPESADGVVFEPGAFKSTEKKSFYEPIDPVLARRDRLALYYAAEKKCDPTSGALFCRKTSDPECYMLVPSLSVSDLVFGNPQ